MKFVIYALSYDEKVGGIIAQHQLCALLLELGCDASVWQAGRPRVNGSGRDKLRWYRWRVRSWLRKILISKIFNLAPGASVRLARDEDLDSAVVIYPEIVAGNPLRAKHVVRWFLHKPGFHTGKVDYGQNELHFYYQKAFDASFPRSRNGGELFVAKVFSDVYRNEGRADRKGRCYVLKKGRERAAGLDLSDGIVIDDLSHREVADVFNRVEYCISYDSYTFYSIYAAMCGCKSIVVPVPGESKEAWQPNERLRYGLAYGENDLTFAAATLGEMEKYWAERDEACRKNVRSFMAACASYFGDHPQNSGGAGLPCL